MIEYEKIVGSEAVRALRLTTTEKGHEYGSSRFKGQTFDIILPNDKIKRVTFGINEIWGTKHVACISETLKFKAENYIDHMLDLAAWENGYD
tara:strand:+ start:153 stop:428 length:276 start_codon:yes stop_codon:yes gene_type:complete